ncbi:MAG: DUF305 domain-containing protein [Rhodothermaceae bacterium]|nr:DUF305 domain-containing protein [Rhodothermaceae bacterium]MYG70745.1 DUF305 domain-containing protein [Rhodothermaceae bacterium]MYJ44888.1 DUF305 domain-containing protein [Rhodothermaceae bacterium]
MQEKQLLSLRFGFFLFLGLCVVVPSIAQDSEELETLFWARKDSALARFSQADVDFMTGMIAHHAQALVMSSFAEPNGASPTIQVLAARIINAQNDEIRIMQEWLRKRDQVVPHIMIEGSSLMIHGADHHDTHMPGMLTDAQLKELEVAQDVEFDRLFLEYMIMHHEGAVHMVRELFKIDGAITGDDTYKLASEIHVDQITEINRMKLMLDDLEAVH